jgi:hypothetical protein
VKLANIFNWLPSTLFVRDIIVESRDPVAEGGFADIFLGTYKKREVALKRVRMFLEADKAKAVTAVSLFGLN